MSFFLFFSPILTPSDPDDDMIPTGTILPFAGATPPAGYVLCYGQSLDRVANAELFSVIGIAYNTGTQTPDQFAVPDLRGRVPAGQEAMGGTPAGRLGNADAGLGMPAVLGATGGAEAHTLSVDQMPSHAHDFNDASQGGSNTAQAGGDFNALLPGTWSGASTQSTGGGGAHCTVQPTLVINYIIKL